MLGLGANLGNPVQQIVDARQKIRKLPGSYQLMSSSLYLSSPVGFSEQADFVNCVIELTTDTAAEALLAQTQGIETAMGRLRDEGNQNAPRIIDIDLLLYDDQVITTPALQVPHPRIRERLFVLLPLLELMQKNDHPGRSQIERFLEHGNFDDQQIHRLVI